MSIKIVWSTSLLGYERSIIVMKTLEFSIIIPFYNAEDSINRCLQSILKQTLPDFEVILIDDGSVDNSNNICRSFVEKDARFKIFNQQNQGPSVARNKGLDVARGNYIIFIDSDDYIEANFLKTIKDAFVNKAADVVFIGYSEYSIEGKLLKRYIPFQKAACNSYFEALIKLSSEDMFGYTWIKSFSRKAIGNIRFPTDMKLFEDEVFTCQVLQKCNNFETVNEPIYNYTTGNPEALTKKTYQNYCELQERVYLEWQKLLNNYKNKEIALINKANFLVIRSVYYGFEKNINPRVYFSNLANCVFFKKSKIDSPVFAYIRTNKTRRLMIIRWKYRIKLHVSQLINMKFFNLQK